MKTSPRTPQRRLLLEDSPVQSPYFTPPRALRPELGDRSTEKATSGDALLKKATNAVESIESTESMDMRGLMDHLFLAKPLLIQEQVAHNPWKLLVAVTLLNKTAGRLAIPTFWGILERWPTPLELSRANEDELIFILRRLGTQTVRAKRLMSLSRLYLQDPPSTYDPRPSRGSSPSKRESRFFKIPNTRYTATPISHLPGAGSYALDSYRIFCTAHENPLSEEWRLVIPTDKELVRYLRWKWAYFGKMEWSPKKGVLGRITPEYVTSLIAELEHK